MRPDLIARRPDRAYAFRTALIFLASVAAIGLAAAAAISGNAKAERARRCADGLTSRAVHGLADLTALFRQQQSLYLRIALPTPDFLLRQSCGTVAFDPQGFPADFLAGLVATTNSRTPLLIAAQSGLWNAFGGPTMDILTSPGTKPWLGHVLFSTGDTTLHAVGGWGNMVVEQKLLMGAARPFLTGIPILSGGGVLATEGSSSWTCLGAAARAFMAGWGL